MDGLSLALATAGDYLRQTSNSFAEYLKRYEKNWQDSQKNMHELSEYEGHTLYTT